MPRRPRTRPGVVPVLSPDARPRVRLTGPGALVSCLPQLIGFEPVESLVLVGLIPGRAGRREVGLTLRVDLDDAIGALDLALRDDDEPFDDEDDLDHHGQPAPYVRGQPGGPLAPCHPLRLVAALVRNRCVAAQVVVVSDRAHPPVTDLALDDIGCYLVAVVEQSLAAYGVDVADAVLVRDGRWWSYLCSRPTCCPPEGTLVSRADADLLAAELAWSGESSVVLPSRELIVAKVAPDSGPVAAAVAGLLSDPSHPVLPSLSPAAALARVADLLAAFQAGGPEVEPPTWAQVLVDLGDVLVRDACMSPWKGEVGAAALALWCAATRVAPRGHVAPPATLAALTAHARGDGALAGEAVTRALTDDPAYRLGNYAAQALGGGIPPTAVRRMVVEATAVLRARGEPVIDASGRLVQQARRP